MGAVRPHRREHGKSPGPERLVVPAGRPPGGAGAPAPPRARRAPPPAAPPGAGGRAQAVAEQQYRDQVQAQRQLILRQILTPEARERLGRIELAYPELKENIENQLIQLAQSGRVKSMIDDATLRQILERVIPRRRDIKIERR